MIVWSPGFVSTPHHHPALQLVLTLSGSLRIRGERRQWKRCVAALVRSNAVHEVDTLGNSVVLAYVHPQSELGTALAELLRHDIDAVAPELVSRWRQVLGSPVSRDNVEQWVSRELLNGWRAPEGDARLRRALKHVRAKIATSNAFPLRALAQVAGLSPSRFLHVFRQEFGVPVRPYIRWLRLQRAACELIAGASLSQAAHRAGFSDAAHMSRTFRRTLGLAPKHIARRLHFNFSLSLPEDGATREAPAHPQTNLRSRRDIVRSSP